MSAEHSRPPIPKSVDCVVIGGGPAGSTVAALVAEAGHRVLLLEREKFPRFHVGESLMPETYWIFERLGVLHKLDLTRSPKKVGVQFVTGDGRESAPFYFRMHDPRDCSDTWHVRRSDFDQMLFENAAEKGAVCLDQVRVLECLFEGERAVGIVAQTPDGQKHQVQSRVVVDASGQQALLAARLGLRRMSPELKKAAVWGYFRGAQREEAHGGVNTIILQTRSRDAWFWYIPMLDDVVSVGVVGDRDYLLRGRGTPDQVYEEELANCPGVIERVAGAERLPELHVAKEFSYSTDRSAGDGWVLVGDAWGFVDPIYSSGVFFAFKSGALAADAVSEGLRIGDTSAAQLGKWEPEFRSATNLIRKLVSAFYSNVFRVGKFIKEYPEHRGRLTDLLIGRIFEPGVEKIFDDLDPWLERMRAAEEVSDPVEYESRRG